MLVSGVWRLWLTPRRKSSLAASSSRSWAFWASTWANSCGVPDRDRDLAREQLQQVLVGALPASASRAGGRRARRAPRRRLRARPGPAAASPGMPLLERDRRRVDEEDLGSRSSRTPPGRRSRPGRRGTRRRRAARRSRSRRGSGRARGSAARGRRRAGCGSRPGGPARPRPGPRSASTGRRPTPGRRPRRSPAAAPIRSAARR